MELEYRDQYPDYIRKAVLSHRASVGIIFSIIVSIASTFAIVLVFRVFNPVMILVYAIAFVLIPMAIIAVAVAKHLSNQAFNEAKKFVEITMYVANQLGTDKVELLEYTPPPYIAVMKHGRYYVVLRYLGPGGAYISILDPVKTEREEGYISIYLTRSREKMTCEEIDSYRLCIYRTLAALAEPLEDAVVEGRFYLYEVLISKPTGESIAKYIRMILDRIEHMRRLY